MLLSTGIAWHISHCPETSHEASAITKGAQKYRGQGLLGDIKVSSTGMIGENNKTMPNWLSGLDF